MTAGISIDGLRGTRSALTISNLGTQLAHVLAASEWRDIAHLFNGRFSDIADHRLMDPEWGTLAREIGDAARRAGNRGQQWTWS